MGNSQGITDKQNKAAMAYVETNNKSEAYRHAYNTANMKPESVHRKAKELFDNVKVAARVKELQEGARKRNEITVDDLVKELEEARIMASTQETAQTSAMIAATLGKAKLLGLVVDKTSHSGAIGTVDLSAKSDEELRDIISGS